MSLRGVPHLPHALRGRRLGSGRREAARPIPAPFPPSPGDDARRVWSLPMKPPEGVEDHRRAAVVARVATMVVTEPSHGWLLADARSPPHLATHKPSDPWLVAVRPCPLRKRGS